MMPDERICSMWLEILPDDPQDTDYTGYDFWLTKLNNFTQPGDDPGLRTARWTEPKLIAEVAFIEWTSDGSIRHPSFQGLREDKGPKEVVRKVPKDPQPSPKPKSKTSATRARNKS
jgi:hypothetical protein